MTARPPPGLGTLAQQARAIVHAQNHAGRIRQLLRTGLTPAQVADRLAQAGVPTLRGGVWRAATVQRVLDLAEGITKPETKRTTTAPEPDPEPEPRRSRLRFI
jgi:hypothetical protein